MPQQDDFDDGSRDRQLASELEALQKERQDIVSGVALDDSPELARVRSLFNARMQVADDCRRYQLANLQLHLDWEKQRAWNEYVLGKARLREQLVISHLDCKRRFDSIKQTVAKKRKRSRLPNTPPSKTAAAVAAAAAAGSNPPARPHLASMLEAHGLVRVALSPDEINRDVRQIVARLDASRAAGAVTTAAAATSGAGAGGATVDAVSSGAGAPRARKADAIHSSRGILHFHNEVFEKGDQIVAYVPGKADTPKHVGVIMSVNSKEMQVKSSRTPAEGNPETSRIYVSHLRKDLLRIKHMPKK